MDHLHAEMDEDGKESAMAWMQFLSGQTAETEFCVWCTFWCCDHFGDLAMVRIVPNLNLARQI